MALLLSVPPTSHTPPCWGLVWVFTVSSETLREMLGTASLLLRLAAASGLPKATPVTNKVLVLQLQVRVSTPVSRWPPRFVRSYPSSTMG